MGIELTAEQRAAVEDRGGALLVSAAAGSGKTRVLVERLMDRVVRDGEDIDRFLVITFTNAAAAELRLRVAQALSERLAGRPQDGRLRRQATLVYQAKICTIDAFCLDFLRECGHLAGVDPDFRVCDEAEGGELLAAALDEVLERRYAGVDGDPGFAALAELLAGDRDDRTLAEMVLDIHRRVQSHPDPAGWLAARRGDFDLPAGEKPEDTAWGRLILEDCAAQAAYWAQALERALEEAEDDVVRANYGPSLERTISDLVSFSLACREGWDEAVRCTVAFPRAGSRKGGDPAVKERLKDVRARCKKQMEGLAGRLDVSAAEAVDDLRALAPAMAALLDVVAETDAAFREAKARRRLLDFSDGEHLAVSLLVGPDGAPTALAREWQERFAEIMVDEYQDTNEVQNVLFRALSKEGKNLFLVGDVKQSIYRFRLADPGIFLARYETSALCGQAAAGEERKCVLSRNFRSRPEVLTAVNFLFGAIMSRELGELDYDEAQALRPGREDWREEDGLTVELNAVDLSSLEDDGEEGRLPKALVEARAVARRAADYLDSLTIGEGGARRSVRPEDMVVLLRSPGPVLHHYARAFDEMGIPWSAEGGEEFFETTEINTALSFLRIIDNPRQDIPLLAVVRSPLFHFSPDRLALLRAGAREGDFYAALEAGAARGEEDCERFLDLLAQLRSLAGEVSSHQLIWELYGRVSLPAVFGAMEGGARRRANLMALYDAALRFEGSGHKGLYGFLTHIARLAGQGKTVPVPGEGGQGVRIMSIHRSKGLEFPVVLLCGLDRQFNDSDLRAPILFHPRLGLGPKRTDRARMLRYTTIAREGAALALKGESRAEEMRLLYVAMTRAERKLALFTTVNGRQDQLSSLAGQVQWPVHPQALRACRSPSGWVLLAALCRREAEPLRSLAGEGLPLAPDDGSPWTVRVIDGREMEKTVERPAPSGGEQVEAEAADPDLAERLSWRYPHAAAVDIPSKLTATQLKGRGRDEEIAADTDAPLKRRAALARPRFAGEALGLTAAQRGSALHLAMQFIRFERAAEGEEAVRAELERLVRERFLTADQAAAVDAAPIAKFFWSELGRQLLAAPRVEREFKFSLLMPASRYYPGAEEGEEVLLQGVVDCWFEDENGITVVDFKTDRVTEAAAPSRAAEYAPQFSAYSDALAAVLGRPVARRVLWFFQLGRGVTV